MIKQSKDLKRWSNQFFWLKCKLHIFSKMFDWNEQKAKKLSNECETNETEWNFSKQFLRKMITEDRQNLKAAKRNKKELFLRIE